MRTNRLESADYRRGRRHAALQLAALAAGALAVAMAAVAAQSSRSEPAPVLEAPRRILWEGVESYEKADALAGAVARYMIRVDCNEADESNACTAYSVSLQNIP
jgi:hypothetical protein